MNIDMLKNDHHPFGLIHIYCNQVFGPRKLFLGMTTMQKWWSFPEMFVYVRITI